MEGTFLQVLAYYPVGLRRTLLDKMLCSGMEMFKADYVTMYLNAIWMYSSVLCWASRYYSCLRLLASRPWTRRHCFHHALFARKIRLLACTSLSSWFRQTTAAKLNRGMISVLQLWNVDMKLPIAFFWDSKAVVQLADRWVKWMFHLCLSLFIPVEMIE